MTRIALAMIIVLGLSGCAPQSQSSPEDVRIETLESQVASLQKQINTLADASLANSEGITNLSESIDMLAHGARIH